MLVAVLSFVHRADIAGLLAMYLLISCVASSLVGVAHTTADGFTHTVFEECFVDPSSDSSQFNVSSQLERYHKYTTDTPRTLHALHTVVFHVAGDFSNEKLVGRMEYYNITVLPTSVYDGGFTRSQDTDESSINASGTRRVHMLEMSLARSIDLAAGYPTLLFFGNVKNLESHVFNGFVSVFTTENHLVYSANGPTWNFIVRDYVRSENFSLHGLSTYNYTGSYLIPEGVKAANLQIFAAAHHTDTENPTGPSSYVVQSVCNICSYSVKIPEDSSRGVTLETFIIAFVVIVTFGWISALALARAPPT